MSRTEAHGQAAYAVRFDWGPTGAAAIARGADVAVVVDVLSFTTTVSVAVERGVDVYPYRWRDDGAEEYAARRDATLARGRSERAGVSLSPGSVAAATGLERLVLPSPNGSSISFDLAGSGPEVVAGCLRNRTAVAGRLAPRVAAGSCSTSASATTCGWPASSMPRTSYPSWTARLSARCDSPRRSASGARNRSIAGQFRAPGAESPSGANNCSVMRTTDPARRPSPLGFPREHPRRRP